MRDNEKARHSLSHRDAGRGVRYKAPMSTDNTGQPTLDNRGLPVGYELSEADEITPVQLQAKLGSVRLIDCRLQREHDLTKIGGEELLPVQAGGAAVAKLIEGREDEETVVYCRSGKRSLTFLEMARAAGATNMKSLAGGVLAWNAMTGNGPQY